MCSLPDQPAETAGTFHGQSQGAMSGKSRGGGTLCRKETYTDPVETPAFSLH